MNAPLGTMSVWQSTLFWSDVKYTAMHRENEGKVLIPDDFVQGAKYALKLLRKMEIITRR